MILLKKATQKAETAPEKKLRKKKPVSNIYPVIDNDLARDNLENDLPEADLNEL